MELYGITTTTDSLEIAEAIAKTLVEERLAACTQIEGPVRSFYRWEGAIEEGEEWRVFSKTKVELVEDAVSRIKAMHNYDVPAILVEVRSSANADYSSWLIDSVADK